MLTPSGFDVLVDPKHVLGKSVDSSAPSHVVWAPLPSRRSGACWGALTCRRLEPVKEVGFRLAGLDDVVMAIAIRTGEETRQVQMVCLDELVAGDDVLRRIERLVDWELVRETARPFCSDFGRPGVDPVVLVKVFLVAAIRGSDSMRDAAGRRGGSICSPVLGVWVDRGVAASRDVQLCAMRAVRELFGV